jgi:hypothetical protein
VRRALFILGVASAFAAGSAAAPAQLPAAQTPAPVAPKVPEAIQRLLDDRAKAIAGHDRALLERTLDPGDFARSELTALDNAGGLAIDSFRLRATTQFAGDLAWPRVTARYPTQVSAWHVIEESRIGGHDLIPYVEDAFYTFVRTGPAPQDPYDGWRVVSMSDFEPLGAYSAVHLWDRGPVVSASSEHFLVLAHADRIERARALLPDAETAWQAVKKFWPGEIGSRYIVIAPSDEAELGDMIHSTVDLSKFVAFAAATARTEKGFEPAGVRIYLQMSHLEKYAASGRRVVLSHELIHAVTRGESGPFMPIWVEEGLAVLGSEPLNKSLARLGSHERFPADDEFSTGPTRDIVAVYYQSQLAVRALADRAGVEGVKRFYDSLGAARVSPGTKDYHVQRALSEANGWTVDEWTKAWRALL